MIRIECPVTKIFFYTCFDFKIQDWSRIGGARALLSPRGQAKMKIFEKKKLFSLSCCQNFIFYDKRLEYKYVVNENPLITFLKKFLRKMVPGPF